MPAKSIAELMASLDQDNVAANFGRKFLKGYAATAFGILPKSEVDLLVFSLLAEQAIIDPNGPIYVTARALNVTPAKARNLIFQYQLRHVPQDKTDQAVLEAITRAHYWKEGDHLSFGVESPLVRAAIAARMRESGVFADISLSGDILKVNPKQFGLFVSNVLPKKAADEIIKALKKGKAVDEGRVRKFVGEIGTKAAEEFLADGAKEGFSQFLEQVGSLATEHGGDAAQFIGDLLDAAL